MGGAHSKLLSIYEIENEFKELEVNLYYKLYNATIKESKEKVSVFVHLNEKEDITNMLLKGLKVFLHFKTDVEIHQTQIRTDV
jgi:hypothetical protein